MIEKKTCTVKPKNARPLCYYACFSNGFVRSDAFWAVYSQIFS